MNTYICIIYGIKQMDTLVEYFHTAYPFHFILGIFLEFIFILCILLSAVECETVTLNCLAQQIW